MKTVREGVFETNSSSTHSLILPRNIMACGVDLGASKEVIITLVPLVGINMLEDNGNLEDKRILKRINSLNHISFMCSYIYTMAMYKKFRYNEDNYMNYVDIMQKYVVELGYKINYKQPLTFSDDILYNWNCKNYTPIEYNDGSDLQNEWQFEEVLKSREDFEYYLKQIWVIAYNG